MIHAEVLEDEFYGDVHSQSLKYRRYSPLLHRVAASQWTLQAPMKWFFPLAAGSADEITGGRESRNDESRDDKNDWNELGYRMDGSGGL